MTPKRGVAVAVAMPMDPKGMPMMPGMPLKGRVSPAKGGSRRNASRIVAKVAKGGLGGW